MPAATVIQNWLTQNEIALRALSVLLVPQHHAHRLAVQGITSPERRAAADVSAILASPLEQAQTTLKQAIDSGISRIVMSSQYFSICEPALVRQQFVALGADQVRIVFVLRRQDRFLEALYEHAVQALGQSASLAVPKYRKDMDWWEVISPWARVFQAGAVALYDYDDLVARGTPPATALLEPVDEFIATLAKHGGSEQAPAILPATLLEFQRLANSVGASGILSRFGKRAWRAGPAFRLDPTKAKELLALYSDSNERVARAFLGRDGALFDESDLEKEPIGADYTGALSVEALAALFALYLKEEQEQGDFKDGEAP